MEVSPYTNLKSTIKDINEYLNSVGNCFNPLHPLFSPSSRIVNHFSSRINFYSSSSLFDENLYQYLQSFNHTFRTSQISSNSTTIIADNSVKKSYVTTVVTHIWTNNSVVKQF